MNGDRGWSAGEFAYAGIAGAVGGLIGLTGVYIGKWFSYTYVTGGVNATFYVNGSQDWTGQVAFIAGVGALAFGIAYVLLSDPQIRKVTAALMGVAGIFLLAMALLGFTRVDNALGPTPPTPGIAPGTAVTITQDVAGGLWMSVAGGAVAVYGAYLAVRRTS